MKYLIVNNGTIENIISADEAFAQKIGALPYYDGAEIGNQYSPPKPSPEEEPSVWDELDAAYQEGVNSAYDE